MAEREKWIGNAGGAEEVVELVETLAKNEGAESACELLDLAARFRDYDIVDYEIYRELIATLGEPGECGRCWFDLPCQKAGTSTSRASHSRNAIARGRSRCSSVEHQTQRWFLHCVVTTTGQNEA
jgi:hypothetical protein